MLILSRREQQRIVIDGGIEIIVLAIRGGHIRLGIVAPEHVGIVRGEIEDKGVAEKRAAVRVDDGLLD